MSKGQLRRTLADHMGVPAFVTLVLGIATIGISLNQYWLSKDKLRLDLFEKRLDAYEELQAFFNEVLRLGCVRQEMLPMLFKARYKSQFLFGKEIQDSFEELWQNSVTMMSLRTHLYGEDATHVGPERTKIVEEESKLHSWIMDQMKLSPDRYAKYLRFE